MRQDFSGARATDADPVRGRADTFPRGSPPGNTKGGDGVSFQGLKYNSYVQRRHTIDSPYLAVNIHVENRAKKEENHGEIVEIQLYWVIWVSC